MLNNDIWLLIFEISSLESCIALSQVCQLTAQVFHGLEDTLIKGMVQRRAPWFQLSDHFTKWADCARVLVARSKSHTSIENLGEVVANCSTDVVSVVPTDVAQDDQLRQSMSPIFNDFRLASTCGPTEGVMEGTRVMWHNYEIDLTTMVVKKNNYDPIEEEYYPHSEKELVSTSSSGLQVRHENPNVPVEVMAENDTLLHVQYNDDHDFPVDEILHKESQPRDEKGMVVISNDPNARQFRGPVHLETAVVNLVPGAAGALIIRHYRFSPEMSYLAYMLPTVDQTVIKLCAVPRQFRWTIDSFKDGSMKFAIPHNGHVFVFACGLLHRLWIDMETQEQGVTTSWNPKFPALGPFDVALDHSSKWRLSQGSRNKHLVTARDTQGCIVGDLNTGKTYFARGATKDSSEQTPPIIPFSTGSPVDSVGFYTINLEVWRNFKLSGGFHDLTERYRQVCEYVQSTRSRDDEQGEPEPSKTTTKQAIHSFMGYMKNAAAFYDDADTESDQREYELNRTDSDSDI